MTKYIWHKPSRKWVPKSDFVQDRTPVFPMIMRDIDPYRSVVTGEMVTSRSGHREHLRVHDLVEVGNEQISGNRGNYIPPSGFEIKEAMDIVSSGNYIEADRVSDPLD